MMRRRQLQQQQQHEQQGGHVARGDHDGDGDQTNLQGYRDGRDKNENEDGSSGYNRGQGRGGLAGAYKVGSTTRRPLLQRVRKAFMPTVIGGLIAWWYDAVGVLIFRNDSRIKGYVQRKLHTMYRLDDIAHRLICRRPLETRCFKPAN